MAQRTAARLNQERGVIFGRYQQTQSSMAARVWCGKVAYFNKKGAKAALRNHLGVSIRAYRCDLCGHWHLTSQAPRREAL